MNFYLNNTEMIKFPPVKEFVNYEKEVWYLSNFIQSYGVLFVLKEPELTILQISNNTELHLGIMPESLLNKNIKELLSLSQGKELCDRVQQTKGDFSYSFQFTPKHQKAPQQFHGLVHRRHQILILEIEPIKEEEKEFDHYGRMKTFLAKVNNETSFQETNDLIVQEIQQLADYDRVVLYRFELDKSGVVIAEAQKNPTTSFLGLRFPASDTPPIGLRTFYNHGLRVIVDLDAPQSAMIPSLHPLTGQPLNLSVSILMGITACHIEYYHNMGVAASCVIPLKDDDQFWGLIVGQHFSPKYISPEMRNYFEYLGQFIALKLIKKQQQESQVYRQDIEAIHAQIQEHLKQINNGRDLQQLQSTLSPCILPVVKMPLLADEKQNRDRQLDSINAILEANGKSLLELLQAQGAALYFGNQLTLIGETPSLSEVNALLNWFSEHSLEDVFSTSELNKLYPAAMGFQNTASGLLGISIRLQNTAYYLLWFRPEVIQTVNWAGNPKPMITADELNHLIPSPRRSFALWQESVRGTSIPWQTVELLAAKNLRDLLTLTALEFSQSALEFAAEQAKIANQAKSHFLAKMSHELRTPLNAILGFSQIMNRDNNLSPEQRQYLKIINRSGEHLLSLINDVLEMSKIEAGRISFNENHFDLLQVIDSIAEMLQLKASSRNLQLILECDAALPKYVMTDESKLRQVLINLLDNAIKFTQNGWVKLRVFLGTEISHVFFEISDTGQGISESELHLLFEPFMQTKTGLQAMQGAGLGLTISKQFVNLMGGELTIQSQVGKGSMFTFDIQVRLAEVIAQEKNSPAQRIIGLEPGQPQYRILVAEDVEENRLLMVKLLTPLGFDIRTVKNGLEAIAVWKKWKPDLIWMDMLMPVMDGYEATRRIKAMPGGKETVIIAITANAFSDAQIATKEAGCDDYMAKPYQAKVLFEKMSQHLGVRYCYRNENKSLYDRDRSNFVLTAESFQVMPQKWISQLHQAALAMDEDLITELIEELPADQKTLAENLTSLVDNFRLDLILNLTEAHE